MNKRTKTGGRVAMAPDLKSKPRRINDYEYKLIQAIRQNSGLYEYVGFLADTWKTTS